MKRFQQRGFFDFEIKTELLRRGFNYEVSLILKIKHNYDEEVLNEDVNLFF